MFVFQFTMDRECSFEHISRTLEIPELFGQIAKVAKRSRNPESVALCLTEAEGLFVERQCGLVIAKTESQITCSTDGICPYVNIHQLIRYGQCLSKPPLALAEIPSCGPIY